MKTRVNGDHSLPHVSLEWKIALMGQLYYHGLALRAAALGSALVRCPDTAESRGKGV